MSKKQQAINFIRERGAGWNWNTWSINDIVLSCEVSPSTIYRAFRELRSSGEMQGNLYTGRKFIRPEELAAAFRDESGIGYLLSDNKFRELCQRFFCDRVTLWKSIELAETRGYLQRRGNGQSTLMYLGKVS